MPTPFISSRAIGAIPDVIALASNHTVVSRVFETVNLPEAVARTPDSYIPQKNLIHFLDEAAYAV
jgi:hypothetical protein